MRVCHEAAIAAREVAARARLHTLQVRERPRCKYMATKIFLNNAAFLPQLSKEFAAKKLAPKSRAIRIVTYARLHEASPMRLPRIAALGSSWAPNAAHIFISEFGTSGDVRVRPEAEHTRRCLTSAEQRVVEHEASRAIGPSSEDERALLRNAALTFVVQGDAATGRVL